MLETKMRYDLMLGDELVGEFYFNMTGYCLDRKKPEKLRGFLSGEESVTSIKREISRWNKESKHELPN